MSHPWRESWQLSIQRDNDLAKVTFKFLMVLIIFL